MNDIEIKKTSELTTFKPSAGIEPTSDFGQDDFSVPWLTIAQGLTKKAMKGSAEYVQGLEPGMFFNSVDSTVYGAKVKVSVIKFLKTYKEVTDEKDGKFVGSLTREQYEQNLKTYGRDYKAVRTPAGNLQKEQYNYFVILADYPEAGLLRLGISPGGFGACRTWNNGLQSFKPGYLYAGIWEIELRMNESDKGAFYTIGVGTKPACVRVGEVSGIFQQVCEGATIALHENISKLSEDDDLPF